MPPKKFAQGQTHGYIGQQKSTYKPKPYVESEAMKLYRKERDICLFIKYGDGEFDPIEVEQIRQKYFGGQQELF